MKLSVEINNLSLEQARSLIYMFDVMSIAGSIGASRTVLLNFVDGDGSFRPRIQYSVSEQNDYLFKNSEQHYKHEVLDQIRNNSLVTVK